MALPGGPWDLQEAITEQRMATRTATAALTLHLDKAPAVSPVSPSSSQQPGRLTRARASKKTTPGPSSSTQSTSHTLRLVQGDDVIKIIDITKLLAGDHEIRLVPPTRATLLYSDPDQPGGFGSSRASSVTGRSYSQVDSQEGSQTGSQSKRNCFLKLCFHSLGDLKAASQAFLRLGLRCKTQFKTQSRSLSRTPSATVVSAPPPQLGPPPPVRSPFPEYGAQNPNTQHQRYHGPQSPSPAFSSAGETSFPTRSYSPHSPGLAQSLAYARANAPYHAAAGGPHAHAAVKRAFTEMAQPEDDDHEVLQRRRSIAARDGGMPGLVQRESSSVDLAASLWPNAVYPHEERRPSRTHSISPNVSRMSSVLQDRLSDPRLEERAPSATGTATETAETPPPRRELPLSIQRHISQVPSQTNGSDEHGRNSRRPSRDPGMKGSTPARPVTVAQTGAQTDEPFVEPETAFFAGMELFQDLHSLKEQMLKECVDATRRLGEGGFVEEEARLVACYALEFRTRFLEACAQKAGLFSREANTGAPVMM